MAKNLSVAQFQDLMRNIPPAVAKELAAGVQEQAQRLAETQRAAAVRGRTGNLAKSVRVEQGRHPLQRLVKAGGPLTTKPVRTGASATYDYALGQELGNEHSPAQPFFYPSYRLLKKSIRSAISRKVKPAIAKIVKVE